MNHQPSPSFILVTFLLCAVCPCVWCVCVCACGVCVCVRVQCAKNTVLTFYIILWFYVILDLVNHGVLTLVGEIPRFRNDRYYYYYHYHYSTHTLVAGSLLRPP